MDINVEVKAYDITVEASEEEIRQYLFALLIGSTIDVSGSLTQVNAISEVRTVTAVIDMVHTNYGYDFANEIKLAKSVTSAAEKVNASISGTILTVTNRNGVSSSSDLAVNAQPLNNLEIADILQ